MTDWHVSSDLSPEDVEIVFRWLSGESYWAKAMPRAVFDRSLATRAAHGLYARYGFEMLPNPTRIMVRNNPVPYAQSGYDAA